MRTEIATDSDYELVDRATEVLESYFEAGRHRTACGIRTQSDEIYTSINLIPPTGPAEAHCESIALGMAVMDGHKNFDTSVAVTYPEEDSTRDPQVISACGVCRELYREFAPDIKIIIPDNGELVKVELQTLLPARPY